MSLQAQVELQIYVLEATYLTETAAHSGGNIIQGFENYLKNQSSGRRKYEVHDHDRVFSNSSLTFQKVRAFFSIERNLTYSFSHSSLWGKVTSRLLPMKST